MERYGWQSNFAESHFDPSNGDMYGSISHDSKQRNDGLAASPNCVKLRSAVITSEQKVKDSHLPRLLSELDKTCKNGGSEEAKGRLATTLLHSSSSPIRKYRLLDFFQLLEGNKDDANIGINLANALTILEKYATNLIKEEKHKSWRIVKFELPLMQLRVLPIKGALNVLKQLGYTKETEKSLCFPDNVDEPDIGAVVILAADLVIARTEVDALLKNSHPFLTFVPPDIRGLEAASVTKNTYPENVDDRNTQITGQTPYMFCGVCSEQNVSQFCEKCDIPFCIPCDERWHRHVNRKTHTRYSLANAKVAEQTGRPKEMNRQKPVPKPRRRSTIQTQEDKTESEVGNLSNTSKHFGQVYHTSGTSGLSARRTNQAGGSFPSQQGIRRPPPLSSAGPLPGQNITTSYGETPPLPPPYSSTCNQVGKMRPVSPHLQQPAKKEEAVSCPTCKLLFSSSQENCPSCGCVVGPATPDEKNRANLALSEASDSRSIYVDMTSPFDARNATRQELPMGRPQLRADSRQASTSSGTGAPQGQYEDGSLYESVGWNCEHCTFNNPMTTHICMGCYKTPTDLMNHPTRITAQNATIVPQGQNASSVVSSNQPQTLLEKTNRVVTDLYSSVQKQMRAVVAQREPLYMTPKACPLEGGIYAAPRVSDNQAPPLPPKSMRSGEGGTGVIKNVQIERERQLTEKERIKKDYNEKVHLYKTGQITDDEFNDVEFSVQRRRLNNVGERKPRSRPDVDDRQIGQLIGQDIAKDRSKGRDEDLALGDDQLLQLLTAGGFSQEPVGESKVTREERIALYEAGLISHDFLHDSPEGHPSRVVKPTITNDSEFPCIDVDGMFNEFRALQMQGNKDHGEENDKQKTTYREYHNYNVTRDLPRAPFPFQSLYDAPLKEQRINDHHKPLSLMSLPNYLGTQRPYAFLEDEGRKYLKWMKQAEVVGFTPEELNLATNLSWQDPKGRNPVEWLRQEWSSRIAEVIGKVGEKTFSENDRIGNISTEEVREALLDNHGSIESACKACIESRREKLAKMAEYVVYGRNQCLDALDAHEGNLENALFELEMKALEPLRTRLLTTDIGPNELSSGLDPKLNGVVTNEHLSYERRVRILYAEMKMRSWGRAETAVRLIDMGYSVADSVEAGEAIGDLAGALEYLRQECTICLDVKPMGQMITYLNCQDRICKDCIADYFTLTVKEKNIHQLSCPVCGLPDLISDENDATNFFNNLDIMMRQIVDEEVHDLFQQKLRDRTLQKEPNFCWCAHCASGFINEIPNVITVKCPNCHKNTCFKCKKQWEPQHEGISCEDFAIWKEENDEQYQREGLAGHLARHGIDCPNCKFRYDLAKGGCMHFTCNQCRHEFCSGCFNAMKRSAYCQLLPSCATRGLHAHHPRDCLFYLRDWDPQRLQQLLVNHEIDYHKTEIAEPVVNDEEVVGAVGGGDVRETCKVMEQKEGPNGLTDDECGAPCEEGHEGLCKMHYNEYLVSLININQIDPSELMNFEELTTVLQRSGIEVLERDRGESEDIYRERLFNHVIEGLPLYEEPIYEEIYEDLNEPELVQ